MRYSGLAGCHLFLDDEPLSGAAIANEFAWSDLVTREGLLANHRDLSLEVSQRLFRQFAWDVSIPEMSAILQQRRS